MSSAIRDPNPRSNVRFLANDLAASDLLALSQTTGDENDLIKAVDNLLNNLGPKFSKVSAELFAKSIGSYRHLDSSFN